MSTPSPTTSSSTGDSARTVGAAVCGVIVVAAVSIVLLGEHIEQLLFGWLYFPLRTIPRMTFDWAAAILGAVCSLAFVVGFHGTARWFLRSAGDGSAAATVRWTWRSTLVVSASMFVLFASGTAIVGATHQFVWLLSGRGDSGAEAIQTEELGAIAQARGAARRSQAKQYLKSFGLAFHNFHDVNGMLPPGGTMTEDGELLHGWAMYVAPYGAYMPNGVELQLPWRTPPNDRIYKCQMHDVLNPAQPGPVFDAAGFGLCHWAGNVHVLPVRSVRVGADSKPAGYDGFAEQLKQSGRAVSFSEITDGTSNTILLGSVGERFKPWGHPANVRDPALGINRSPEGFGGPPAWHGGMFLMCDGSVKFLDEKTDLKIMKALATPAGGETIPADFAIRHLR